MYRVLVVDDEPAAIRHICNIIATQCPKFEVMGTAEQGRQALRLMEQDTPDVLITDVKMPGMDGIALTSKVKERYPQVFSLVVSGYDEFAYAKAAIKTGVYDYLLKPINPSTLQGAMAGLQEKLDGIYAGKRNRLMKSLCEKSGVGPDELKRYFPLGGYYAAIVRRGGLPRRYLGNSSFEIFSGKEENIYLYGRDEMETLYLCPEDVAAYKSFYQIISETIRREYRNASFVTGIIKETAFPIQESGGVFEELYQALDSNIVTGSSRILALEELAEQKQDVSKKEPDELRNMESCIQKGQKDRVIETVDQLFALWEHTGKTQMYVEAQVRYLFVLLEKSGFLAGAQTSIERVLDDIFYYAESMEEVAEVIRNILVQKLQKETPPRKMDTEVFFEKVTAFLHRHLADELSMRVICKEFGLSSTYLNKLFRKYSGHSFNKFLTLARIGRAKEIMSDEKPIYVKDVAARTGYNDQFYFSRIFTAVEGLSPSDYMEQLQKKGPQAYAKEK